MKLELLFISITAFLIYNTYHDGKYTKLLLSYKKYYQMIFFAFIAFSLYLLLKRNPSQCKNILLHANNIVKYMPIDKNSMDMISPIIDFTNTGDGFMNNLNKNVYSNNFSSSPNMNFGGQINENRNTATKRSVSETKKKHVASLQDWKCGHCKIKLPGWYEVDHITRLEYGGSNEISNLVALCRDCHGKKTAMENM